MQITDRSKDVIKSGGEWISSVDVENTLMDADGVLEAAVIAVPDDRWGGAPAGGGGARAGLRRSPPRSCATAWPRSLARWQLPERWAFIDEVPKTSVGKFDKKVIRKSYAAGELEVQELAPPPA